MGKTSKQWWEETKADPEKFNTWLRKQYLGEMTAAERIERYCIETAPDKWKQVLWKIAGQERTHAGWVADLLEARGISPSNMGEHFTRYWDETLEQIDSFEKATAVAAHAENMRLERIEVIASDLLAPKDVRETFQRILGDELFHASAFEKMAGSKAMAETLEAHIHGREAIGLVNVSEVL